VRPFFQRTTVGLPSAPAHPQGFPSARSRSALTVRVASGVGWLCYAAVCALRDRRVGTDMATPCCLGASIVTMVITPGRVVARRIVVEGDPFPEGAVVTILAREGDETFELSASMEAELLESLAEADCGETVSAEEVLHALRNPT
jgi:hypothetical protein